MSGIHSLGERPASAGYGYFLFIILKTDSRYVISTNVFGTPGIYEYSANKRFPMVIDSSTNGRWGKGREGAERRLINDSAPWLAGIYGLYP
jgi:hypothetical protein